MTLKQKLQQTFDGIKFDVEYFDDKIKITAEDKELITNAQGWPDESTIKDEKSRPKSIFADTKMTQGYFDIIVEMVQQILE